VRLFTLQLIVALVLLPLVQMASAGEFRPVTEIPMPGVPFVSPASEEMTSSSFITPGQGLKWGFPKTVANLLSIYPCPVVGFFDPSVEMNDVVNLPDNQENTFKKYMRAMWLSSKLYSELKASGQIGTPTGDKLMEQSNKKEADLEKAWKDEMEHEKVSGLSDEKNNITGNESNSTPRKTWKDTFEILKSVSSDYRIFSHKDFLEIGWGDSRSLDVMKANMAKEVPPITFICASIEQSLPMWQTVSGLTIDYDPVLLVKPKIATEEKEDLPESVAEDMTCGEEEREKEYESNEVLTVTRTLPIQEFMDLLASTIGGAAKFENGRWKIGTFVGDATGERVIWNILAELKGSPYGFGTVEERLVKLGLPALPFILREFESAEDYFLSALTGVLATMDAPERDAAFLNKLRIGSATGDQFLEDRFDSTMMYVLAHRGVKEVIPIAQKYATQDRRSNVDAKICLNLLDAPLPQADPVSLLIVGITKEEEFRETELAEVKEILYATIDQCWDGTKPLRLCEIGKGEKGIASFGGPLGDHGGTWEIRVGKPEKERVSVALTWYTGPLAAAGYEGYAEKRNGRWLFTKWWMKWIS
jgi:hypothetical protein